MRTEVLLLLCVVVSVSLAAVYNGQYRRLTNRLNPVIGSSGGARRHTGSGRSHTGSGKRVFHLLSNGRSGRRRGVGIRRRPIGAAVLTSPSDNIGPADALRAGEEGSYDFADQFNAILPDKNAGKPTKSPPRADANKINIESRIPPPAVAEQEKTTIVEKARVGSTAIVHCTFDDVNQIGTYEAAKIWWTKLPEKSPERPVLLAAGSQVRVPDDRLRVLTYPDNTYSVLVIKDVLLADAGQYKCSLPTVSGTRTSFTSLSVIESNDDLVTISPKETTLNAGEKLHLFCRPTNPSLNVWWTAKDAQGNNMRVSIEGLERVAGRTLNLEDIQRDQAGIYTCHIENRVGSPLRRHFTLEVKEKPWEIEAYIGGFQLNALLSRFHKDPNYGENVDLRCDTGGVPTPTIEWYKSNTLITGGRKYTINLFEPSYKRNAVIGKLSINDFQPADDGLYYCKASNDVGNQVQYFSINGAYNLDYSDDEDSGGYRGAALNGRSGSITVKKCVGRSCTPSVEKETGSGGYWDDEN